MSVVSTSVKALPQVLGLWGMGGIGKTTLAAKLFNSLLPDFGDQACFLENVRSEASHAGGIVKLQQQLLKVLTGGRVVVDDMSSGPHSFLFHACSLSRFRVGHQCCMLNHKHFMWQPSLQLSA